MPVGALVATGCPIVSAERLQWYWHRMRAMDAAEVRSHLLKKWRQFADGIFPAPVAGLGPVKPGAFPVVPGADAAPEELKRALAADLPGLLRGNWRAFGHIDLKVDIPPRWQKDYLAGVDLDTRGSAFRLNHRKLPGRADIKLVWELSRWSPLARLAQAGAILGNEQAAALVLQCLQDWVRCNPPYRGWNWTSALESGLRLIQFAWMEALLGADRLRSAADALLPSHVHYTWRHRSFGSSANNHLLGELSGLVISVARRPELARYCAPLETLKVLWETEVLRQFHEDGGNVEQALNYHLFSFEFCWQVRLALKLAGLEPAAAVEERLQRAVDFFVAIQVDSEPWDYGDSDSAWVTPLFAKEGEGMSEWLGWANGTEAGRSISFWLGEPPPPHPQPACVSVAGNGMHFEKTGILGWNEGCWNLRWDLSELGYLATAAHGHLDALHVSLWAGGRALVVDPGTGAYYGDRALRNHLASWKAHNTPIPAGLNFPTRRGPFLWAERHVKPEIDWAGAGSMRAKLPLPEGVVERTLTRLAEEDGWRVDDDYVPNDHRLKTPFEVCWQFAPGWTVKTVHDRMFVFSRDGVSVEVGLDSAWQKVELILPAAGDAKTCFHEGDFTGVCSRQFREVQRGPLIRLLAPGHNPCLFRTTFLASRGA